MDEEELKHYKKAGNVIKEAREKARDEAVPGKNLKTLADNIEDFIREKGLKPAFPVNLSINEEAAHYSPPLDEKRELKEDDLLKIDIGAHSNGYIADTALTINPSSKHVEMIECVENVLKKTLEFLEPGKTVGEIGTYIEKQIPQKFQPVNNLTGHYLGKYTQHAGISIPNVENSSQHEIKEGDAIAIEPFITNGAGKVKKGRRGNIYKLEKNKGVRGRAQREILGEIKNFNNLPFSPRWLSSFKGRKKMAFNKLVKTNIIHSYPVLKEVKDGLVAQAEHTVLIGMSEKGKNIITTKK